LPDRGGAVPGDDASSCLQAVGLHPQQRPPGRVVAVVGEYAVVVRVVGVAAGGGNAVGAPVGAGGGNVAVAAVLTEAAGAIVEGAAAPGS